MGKSQKRELWSRLRTLMEHLLYIAYLTRDPEREGYGWKGTVIAQRDELAELLNDNPSLKHRLDETTAGAYLTACKLLFEKSEEMSLLKS